MAKKLAKPKPSDDPEDAGEEPDVEGQSPLSALPPRREVSTPAKASCLTFVFLFLVATITIIVAYWTERLQYLTWYWCVTIVALVFIIPVVVYRAVSLWMFDEIGRFPDIAAAWKAGIAGLRRNGMSLASAPLFVILGTGNDKLRRNFMSAVEGDFFVDGNADPPAPLHWYVNTDGIFLYLNDASWMNAAITLYEIQAAAIRSGRAMPGDVPAPSVGGRNVGRALGTLMPDIRSPAPPQPGRRAEFPSDSAGAGDFNPADAAAQPHAKSGASEPNGGANSGDQYMGTLMPGQVAAAPPQAVRQQGSQPQAPVRPGMIAGKRVSVRLTSEQSSLQMQRLENVCGLLRRHRHPLCPANGILTLLPFEMLKAADQDVKELERAISADLATIYRELQLRCPVTAVVVGMEQERGFRELIRRIGRDGSLKQRFGQRFDVRAQATIDELRKFTSHVCGTFEDWVYTLFRDEEALSHPGNTSLYALLCKVRRTLKTRLGDILGNGFGCDRQSTRLPVLFSGCYFAATGPKSDRQAFVSGLLSKLYDEQEDIEWTDDALRDNGRRGLFAAIGWIVCGAIVLTVAGFYTVQQIFG